MEGEEEVCGVLDDEGGFAEVGKCVRVEESVEGGAHFEGGELRWGGGEVGFEGCEEGFEVGYGGGEGVVWWVGF